jgi:hypothetical protein
MNKKADWNQLDGSFDDQVQASREFCGLKPDEKWKDIIIPEDDQDGEHDKVQNRMQNTCNKCHIASQVHTKKK